MRFMHLITYLYTLLYIQVYIYSPRSLYAALDMQGYVSKKDSRARGRENIEKGKV